MKIAYHKSTGKKFNAGADYYYKEITGILDEANSSGTLDTQAHDFFTLMGDPDAAKQFVGGLGPLDTVISNIGPYAHLYHHLREKYAGSFRIVREVRTTSWAGFLLQEHLSGPMVRPGDLIIFPSQFSRRYFMQLFPRSLTRENTRVCYPLAVSLPEKVDQIPGDGCLRVGYVGRMSDDKNFPQVLSIFARLHAQTKGKARLILAGKPDRASAINSQRAMRDELFRLGVPESGYQYLGSLNYRQIWDFFANIDVLLFPGLANVESLGRVLIEAARARVPVVAAHYAAAPELLPPENLVKTRYSSCEFDTNGTFTLGRVDEDDAVAKILAARLGEDSSRYERYQPQTFFNFLRGDLGDDQEIPLTAEVESFIGSVRLEGIGELGFAAALEKSEELSRHFRRYHDNGLSRIGFFLGKILFGDGPLYRKFLYFDRIFKPRARQVLGHAREHCLVAGFASRMVLKPPPVVRQEEPA